jgi:hypothetical protein
MSTKIENVDFLNYPSCGKSTTFGLGNDPCVPRQSRLCFCMDLCSVLPDLSNRFLRQSSSRCKFLVGILLQNLGKVISGFFVSRNPFLREVFWIG